LEGVWGISLSNPTPDKCDVVATKRWKNQLFCHHKEPDTHPTNTRQMPAAGETCRVNVGYLSGAYPTPIWGKKGLYFPLFLVPNLDFVGLSGYVGSDVEEFGRSPSPCRFSG
jgi:hypothetical protein